MARRYSGLWPQITDFGNLLLAFRRAAKGKRCEAPAATFELDLEINLSALQRELEGRTYGPGGYYSFYIRDPKRRLISAAPFRDRVVHHALCRVIEPVFERTFIGDSYANRVGKGTHRALDRAQHFARRHPYVLQCDVRQFFASIDHAVLRAILARKLDDEGALWLCELILASGTGVLEADYDMVFFPGDDLLAAARPRGLPIGNLTSQFWANVYLNELDQFVKRVLGCTAFLRYADDFLLFADSKALLWEWRREISDFLERLRLRLHEGSSTVYPVEAGIPFLGFRVYPHRRRLKRRNGVLFQRRLRRDYRAFARGELDWEGLNARVRGWVAHAAHGDTEGLRSAIFRERVPCRERIAHLQQEL